MSITRSGFFTVSSGGAERTTARASAWIRLSKLPVSYLHFGFLVAVSDFLWIVILGAGSSAGYHYLIIEELTHLKSFSAVAVASAMLFCLLLQSQHLYRTSSLLNSSHERRAILASWAMVFCILMVVGFLGKVSWEFSRGATICFFVSGAFILPLSHALGRRSLKFLIATHRLAGRRRIVLFGDADQLMARNLAPSLSQHGYSVIDEIGMKLSKIDHFWNIRQVEAAVERLKNLSRNNHIDEVFLALESSDQKITDIIAHDLRSFPMPVRLLFDEKLSRLLARPIADLGTARSIKLQSGPLTDFQQLTKRLFDLVISTVALVVLAPLLLVIATAIRLDSSGPVMFRQRRAGFSGRIFKIYKFRSMTTLDDGGVIKQATQGDNRVTRVGRFIRKTSLDELPQLLNVIKGEMSLVGPRPHALSHDNEYYNLIATYALRHNMKPGITGWAQVNGCRGETSDLSMMEARVRHDLWYIKHWSLGTDIKAIMMTVMQVVRPRDVY